MDRLKAADVKVEYDRGWGFPTSVHVDQDKNAIHDEYAYGIEDFKVLSS